MIILVCGHKLALHHYALILEWELRVACVLCNKLLLHKTGICAISTSFIVCGVFWIGVHTWPEVRLRQSKQSPEIGNTQSCPPTDLTRTIENGHHQYGHYEYRTIDRLTHIAMIKSCFRVNQCSSKFSSSSFSNLYIVHDLFSLVHQIDIWTFQIHF